MPDHDPNDALSCSQIWGGTQSTRKMIHLPRLECFVDSVVYRNEEAGGDVYLFASCSAGVMARMFLGDVSGHGLAANQLAEIVRGHLLNHIDDADNAAILKEINKSLHGKTGDSFVTMLSGTYHTWSRMFVLANAGHPNGLHYQARFGKWRELLPEFSCVQVPDDNGVMEDFPLGILENTGFSQGAVKMEPGDLALFYSDAYLELDRNSRKPAQMLEALNNDPITQSATIDKTFEKIQDRIIGKDNCLGCDDDATAILLRVAG